MAKQTFTTGQVLTSAEMTALQLNDYNQTVSAKTANYVLVAADAGTRITMSNAGATTITVNTSLFAAGDTLFITNIGAGACTITAGTATVSTASSLVLAQYDSGTLYFTSTGVAIWQKYQGAAAGGSSALTKIVTGTFSAVANTGTTFDACFTSTYKNYLVVFSNMKSSATTDLLLQLRVAGVTTATNYYGSYSVVPYNTTISSTGSNNATSAKILPFNSVADPSSLNLTFSGVGNSSSKAVVYGNGYTFTQSAALWLGYQQETAAVYDGFILSVGSGNTTGTVTVYGLAN